MTNATKAMNWRELRNVKAITYSRHGQPPAPKIEIDLAADIDANKTELIRDMVIEALKMYADAGRINEATTKETTT